MNSSKITSCSSFVYKNLEVISINNKTRKINSLKSIKKSNSCSVILTKTMSKILTKNILNVFNENKEKNHKKNDKDSKHIYDDKNNNNKISQKSEKKSKKVDLYGQNYNLENMRKIAPKASELFYHIYNIKNIYIYFKDNETLGNLNRDIIPNVFYNHMIYNREHAIYNNKCKYLKACIVQRNKKKLLSVIYYFPYTN